MSHPGLPALSGVAAAAAVVARHWAVLATLGVSAWLRFWGIAAGIPYAVGADEPVIMSTAVRMMKTGDLNPHFFDYPSLYIYVQFLTACVRFLVGASAGAWTSLNDVGAEDFYLWGRAVTALLGVATTLVVYRCGMYWGRTHAAVAGMAAAVFPLHVRESHYVLTDVPGTFFVALTLLFSLRAAGRATPGAAALAGAAAGLASATKYNNFVAVILPVLAAASVQGATRLSCILAALGAAAAAFLLAAPYTLLDLPAFLDGFAKLAGN